MIQTPEAFRGGRNEVDILKMYRREVRQFRLLNAEDEVELGRRIRTGIEAERLLEIQNNETVANELPDSVNRYEAAAAAISCGKEAWSLLVTSNLRLVISVAKKYSYQSKHLEFLDVIQDGNIGLCRAAEKFDYRRGVKFSTYAMWWIRQSIGRGLAEKGRVIRLPVDVLNELHKMNKVKYRLEKAMGRAPTVVQIWQHTEFHLEKIRFLQNIPSDPVSLDAPLASENGDRYSLVPYLDAEGLSVSDPEEVTVRHLVDELVRSAVQKLEERESIVLVRRFGLNGKDEETLEEVGAQLNLSRERVRQIQEIAIQKLRDSGNLRGLLDPNFDDGS